MWHLVVAMELTPSCLTVCDKQWSPPLNLFAKSVCSRTYDIIIRSIVVT